MVERGTCKRGCGGAYFIDAYGCASCYRCGHEDYGVFKRPLVVLKASQAPMLSVELKPQAPATRSQPGLQMGTWQYRKVLSYPKDDLVLTIRYVTSEHKGKSVATVIDVLGWPWKRWVRYDGHVKGLAAMFQDQTGMQLQGLRAWHLAYCEGAFRRAGLQQRSPKAS